MSLTHSFRETVQARINRDSEFRKELLQEAIDLIFEGDVDTGITILCDYISRYLEG